MLSMKVELFPRFCKTTGTILFTVAESQVAATLRGAHVRSRMASGAPPARHSMPAGGLRRGEFADLAPAGRAGGFRWRCCMGSMRLNKIWSDAHRAWNLRTRGIL